MCACVPCRGLILLCRVLQPTVSWPGPRQCHRMCGRVASVVRRSWIAMSWPCVATQASSLKLLPCHNTLQCIATQNSQPNLLFQSRYTQCIVTQCLKPTSGHNTLLCIAIQSSPNPPAALVTIQFFYCNTNPQPFKPLRPAVSQYNFPLYCDTVGQ